jgi:hypothetical protein
MSRVALRIRYNAGSLPLTDVDFYENEVGKITIFEGRNSYTKRTGTGKPREVRRTGFGSINIAIRIHSSNTITRLLQLEQCAYNEFWVYARFVAEPGSPYYRGLLVRGSIPDAIGVAGSNAGLEEISLQLLETTKVTYQYGTGPDDEYMDDIDETSPTEP